MPTGNNVKKVNWPYHLPGLNCTVHIVSFMRPLGECQFSINLPATFQLLKTHFNSPQSLTSLVTGKPHIIHHLSLVMFINSKLRLKLYWHPKVSYVEFDFTNKAFGFANRCSSNTQNLISM